MFNEAPNLFNKALVFDKKLGDKKFIAVSYVNLSRTYFALNQIPEAIECANQSLTIANEIGSLTHTQWSLQQLSQIYTKNKQYEKALYFFQMATHYKDSLFNEKSIRSIAMMELMYETEKKEKHIELLQKSQQINEKEIARLKAVRYFYMAAFVFLLISTSMIFYALRIKQKANNRLAQQKSEIEKSNAKLTQQQEEILIQNKEIEIQRSNIQLKNKNLEEAYSVIEGYIGKMTDSIRYAERIQQAILTPLSLAKPFFSEYFCMYRPKDYVSGDFYWLCQKEDTLFVAVADCTGHGVPGAFMSIIGMDLLNQAVKMQNIDQPVEILNFLNLELRKKLQKEKEEPILKDSMDIAVCSITKGSNKILYSGALIPIVIKRNKGLIDYRPNFVSIGTSTEIFNVSFKQQDIEVEPGDWIYLFSDGYMDQFGGRDKKKFMKHRFLESILTMDNIEGNEQKKEFERIFDGWKGNHEQIDDVLILGLRV